jgi:hypothetical protein
LGPALLCLGEHGKLNHVNSQVPCLAHAERDTVHEAFLAHGLHGMHGFHGTRVTLTATVAVAFFVETGYVLSKVTLGKASNYFYCLLCKLFQHTNYTECTDFMDCWCD